MTEEINTTSAEEAPESNPVAPAPVNSYPLEEQEPPVEREKPSSSWLLILNIILLIGLVVLYFLFFNEKGKDGGASMAQTLAKAGNGSMAVAFVNNDSILVNYDLVKKLKKDLEAKGDRLTAEVAAKQKAFDKDAAYFQDQVQKKAISEASAQEIYSSLMQNQQKINELRDQYTSELQREEQDMNIALLDSVMNFLKRYNTRYKFDYILGFNKGGNILYANDTLDITNNVLKELNKEYHDKNPDK
jgi:outer membrane protein